MAGVEVRHAMTKEVYTVRAEASLADAARIMRRERVSGLPVINDSGKAVGILSEKDILRSLEEPMPASLPASLIDLVLDRGIKSETRLAMMRERLETERVGDWMTQEPVTIAPGSSLRLAAQIMLERKINRLPVVDGDRLVGIITRHDVLGAL